MKRLSAIAFSILLSTAIFAQPAKGVCRPKTDFDNVEKMVSDLSSVQKKRIEVVTEKTKIEVFRLKDELDSVRGQIKNLHDKEGDQSERLFPLYDRESHLMSQISKVMYKCRVKIDEILTPEQIKEMRGALEEHRQRRIKAKYHYRSISQHDVEAGKGDTDYMLEGRRAKSIPSPKGGSSKQGKIVVKIWVDRNGTVTKVEAPEKGSTIMDAALVNLVRAAAMKAKFSAKEDSPQLQVGTITYRYQGI